MSGQCEEHGGRDLAACDHVALTEEQIEAAKAEIAKREEAQRKHWQDEYYRKVREAEERFYVGMDAKYPGISRDTMHDIYGDMRDFFE